MRPLLTLLLLSACQPSLTRAVNALHGAGDYVEATDLVLRAVLAGDARAVAALPDVAERAYALALDRAREAEADDHLPAALAAFDRALALEARVVAAGGPTLPPHVGKERADVARRTAFLYATRAAAAFDDGRTAQALEDWTLAEKVGPGLTDAHRRIPVALTTLGDEAREASRYREALARYDEAARAGAGERPRVWAAAIHAAWGRYALKAGACRRAVEELTAAAALPFDLKLATDLEDARACATREIVIHPFADLVEGGLSKPNLNILLADQLGHHVRTHGSGFVRLLDPSSKAARQAGAQRGVRFDVHGHLTRLKVDQPAPTRGERTTIGRLLVPCQAGGEPTCTEQVTVAFDLEETTLSVALAGAVRVVDRATGEQVALRPLEMRLDKVRRVATPTRVTDARGFVIQAPVSAKATDRTVGVAAEVRPWFEQPDALPDPVRVLDEAVARLAAEAAEAVLAAVDAEPDLPDPTQLTLVTPIMNADDISFGDAAIEVMPDPEPPEGEPSGERSDP
jgi:tetratricopeptide (TPR) repeat protein